MGLNGTQGASSGTASLLAYPLELDALGVDALLHERLVVVDPLGELTQVVRVLRDRRVGFRVHIGECDGVPVDPECADPDR